MKWDLLSEVLSLSEQCDVPMSEIAREAIEDTIQRVVRSEIAKKQLQGVAIDEPVLRSEAGPPKSVSLEQRGYTLRLSHGFYKYLARSAQVLQMPKRGLARAALRSGLPLVAARLHADKLAIREQRHG